MTQIAKDFGVSQKLREEWVKQADIEDGHHRGTARDESAELREARKRIRQLEQEAEGAVPSPTSPAASTRNDLPAGPRPGR